MALSLQEIKDLLTFGLELGLQQLQTEGLIAIYGPAKQAQQAQPEPNETADLLARYSAIGRKQLTGR